MNNTDWLKDLKPGHKVAYDSGTYGRIKYNIVTVEKITPSGIIKTSDGNSWTKEGRQKGIKASSWETPHHLKPLTQEIRNIVEKETAVQYLSKMDFKKLPLDALRHIVGVIEMEKTKGE